MHIPFSKKIIIELTCILVVGIAVFFVRLSTIPSGLYIDETLPAYSAYSVIKTGKDEYGKVLPLVFRFYGSYNPPLFIYFVAASEVLFGLTAFAVRAPSALAGLLSVVPIYFLLKDRKLFLFSKTAFVSALLFVITPWIVLHSRVGYEVSLGFLLLTTGVYFIYRGITQSRYLALGMFFLSLSTYAAYAERFIVPFFLVMICLVFRNELLKVMKTKEVISAVVVGVVTQIPNLWLLSTPAFFPKQNLFGSGILTSSAEKIAHYLPYNMSFVLAFAREFLSQYVTYFSPQSLFFVPNPDLQRSIPYLSVFYVWMIIPFCVGIYSLYKNNKFVISQIILILLFVAPIPAALTLDPFSTHRALPLLLPLFLVVAIGIDRILSQLSAKQTTFVVVSVFLFSLAFLWRSYFVLLPYTRAQYWGYGHEELANFVVNRPTDHFVIDQTRIKPVYSQLLFYMKYDPQEFQKTVDPSLSSQYYENTPFDGRFSFGNIETRGIVWETDIYQDQILVGDTLTISESQAREHELSKVFEAKDHVGNVIFEGYKTNPAKKCRISNYASKECIRFKP